MKYLLLGMALVTLPVCASDLKSEQSKMLAEQLVNIINQKLSDISALEVAAGAHQSDISINLSQDSRFDSGRFGIIMDKKNLGHILSVTPNSPASQLGLQSGDVLLHVNGTPITNEASDWKANLQHAKSDSFVNLTVSRAGKELQLSGALKGKYVPSWQLTANSHAIETNENKFQELVNITSAINGASQAPDYSSSSACGRVIVYTPTGREPVGINLSARAHLIDRIDGNAVATGKSRHKLTPGKHVLELVSIEFNDELKHKKFTINVAANMTYEIGVIRGAQWQNKDGSIIVDESYSGPAVIKQREQVCTL